MFGTQKVMQMIKEHEVKYVDFRFTDPRGKWQHLAHHIRTITEDFLNEGVMFDGSSIAGWKAINESDMMLVPDCSTAVLDPFAAQTSLIIFCDVHEPLTGQPYSRDPRSIAKKAEQYLLSTGIGDTAYFGPEAEFFIFGEPPGIGTGANDALVSASAGLNKPEPSAPPSTAVPAAARPNCRRVIWNRGWEAMRSSLQAASARKFILSSLVETAASIGAGR